MVIEDDSLARLTPIMEIVTMTDEESNSPPPPPPGMTPPPPPPMDAAPPPPPMDAAPPPPPMDAAPPPPPMDAAPPPPPMDAAPPPPPMDAAPPPPPMDAAPPPPPMDAAPPPPPMDEAPPAPPNFDLLTPTTEEVTTDVEDVDSDLTASAADLLGGLSLSNEVADSEDDVGSVLDNDSSEDDVNDALETTEAVDPLSTPLMPEEESEDDSDAEEEIIHAGAVIRNLEQVDQIPGDKLEGSLHEVETATLNVDGEVIDQNVDGLLRVNNPSEKDRLWDIDIFLNKLGSTDVEEKHQPIQELEAGQEHSSDYSVSGPVMLSVRERIDTKPEREQERSTSAVCTDEVQNIVIELEVENVGPVDLHNVEVTREIPEQITIGEGETHTVGKNTLTWIVGDISPGGKRTLPLNAELLTEVIDEVSAGMTSATYSADATLSGMSIGELDAFCRGFSYMDVEEDERPDNWRCQAVFENRSSFAVDLVRLQVKQAGTDELLFDITDVEKDVHPDGRWESQIAVVPATEEPNFNQELGFTVIPRVTHSTEGSINLEQYTIKVLEAEVNKTYSTDILRTYREATVNSEITIKNTGTATINLMRLTDDVPGIFNSPDLDQISCTIDGDELVRDQFRIEVREGVTIEQEALSPDGLGHTMLLTIGTKGPIGLEPGQEMSISYPLIAPDPTPNNDTVSAPLRSDFSSERFGPVATRLVEGGPSIRVIHKRRKFSTGKEVYPAGGAGRYEVLIMFQNRSDSALQDLLIHDIVPSSFEIKGYNIRSDSGVREAEMEKADDENGIKVTWHIPVIEKDERIEVIYELVGDSDAEYKVSEAQEFHGATFGDELDVDLPPPAPEEEEEEVVEEEEVIEDDAADEESTDDESEDDDSGDEDEAEEESADDDSGDEDEAEEESGGDDEAEDDSGDDEESDDGEEATMDAALAQITGEGDSEDDSSDDETSEEPVEESSDEGRTCPICSAVNAPGANVCGTCSFDFE